MDTCKNASVSIHTMHVHTQMYTHTNICVCVYPCVYQGSSKAFEEVKGQHPLQGPGAAPLAGDRVGSPAKSLSRKTEKQRNGMIGARKDKQTDHKRQNK